RDAGARRRQAAAAGPPRPDPAPGGPVPATGDLSAPGDALTRNRRRAAVEQAVRHLPPEEALSLLFSWAGADGRGPCASGSQDEVLRSFVGRQLLRLLLLRQEPRRRPAAGEVLDLAGDL